ncbi:MAG: endopeptidase La [Armatimonadetes bacterium CG_4_10_14_0_8_um_filter_66_14]|nr:MAG: endopeptidase La [Armatimonadetes bacterium CG_4_10_14_0_8_um_filter_66_14]
MEEQTHNPPAEAPPEDALFEDELPASEETPVLETPAPEPAEDGDEPAGLTLTPEVAEQLRRTLLSQAAKVLDAGDVEDEALPLFPLKGMVLFPHMIAPLFVERDKSKRAIDEAMHGKHQIVLVAQKQLDQDDPTPEDMYTVGTVGECMQVLRMPDESVRLVVEGGARVRIVEYVAEDPCFRVRVEPVPETADSDTETVAWVRRVLSQFEQVVKLGRTIPPEALESATRVEEPGRLADIVTSYLDLRLADQQRVLETASAKDRLAQVCVLLAEEIQILEIDQQIDGRVRKEVGASQREYFLRERLRIIQEELGERDAYSEELNELRTQIEKARMPAEAREKALHEWERLERMPPIAPEVSVIRNYLDWMVSLPWHRRTKDRLDIERAEAILDEDHYGLKDIKERIVEFLAVRKLKKDSKGPILCFIGPPGVGKTSIGRSIARALGRKFVRVSLGGIHDEAEIRGHRRTYIGSMPGRLIQSLRRVRSRNPVFMLDEIDKVGADYRGDPTAAMLEALDPEQNDQFSDHYLEVPFDLSEIVFIATGNIADPIAPALRDRMEIVEFPGYVDQEKLCIARQFLVPKQLRNHGLRKSQLEFTDTALRELVRGYTREAGVRTFERQIAAVCRKHAKQVAGGRKGKVTLSPQSIRSTLGPREFLDSQAEKKDEIGVTTGLAWSEEGGDILSIEVGLMPGKGEMILTGQLGEVMQESARAAISYARSRAEQLELDPETFEKVDIHMHVPAAAIPKDGPSAGIAMATALISALTSHPVRKEVCMTGEITLRGKARAVGGVKEKILAAHRAGLKHVILPKENRKDLQKIPENVRRAIRFHFVDHMDAVLEAALTLEKPEPQPPRKPSKRVSRRPAKGGEA